MGLLKERADEGQQQQQDGLEQVHPEVRVPRVSRDLGLLKVEADVGQQQQQQQQQPLPQDSLEQAYPEVRAFGRGASDAKRPIWDNLGKKLLRDLGL